MHFPLQNMFNINFLLCISDCKTTTLGKEYDGTLSRTNSGKTCQAWTAKTPHNHNRDMMAFPDGSAAAAENYCRNPDDEPNGPWCYTTDPNTRWQYCNISMCLGKL